MIAVDASVLVEFLLDRAEAVKLVADAIQDPGELLHAPELIDLEVLNTLRGLVRGDKLDADVADQAAADLAVARVVRWAHGPLRGRIWELRHTLSAYDAAYLALAETLRDPLLG